MDRSFNLKVRLRGGLGLLVLSASSAASAGKAPDAQPTITLQRVAIPSAGRELGMGVAVFGPNAEKPRHRATGPELCYVLAGEVSVTWDDGTRKTYRVGETFQLPANVDHLTVAGSKGAKILAAWVSVPGKDFNIPPRR